MKPRFLKTTSQIGLDTFADFLHGAGVELRIGWMLHRTRNMKGQSTNYVKFEAGSTFCKQMG